MQHERTKDLEEELLAHGADGLGARLLLVQQLVERLLEADHVRS